VKLYVMRHGAAEDHSPTGRDADRALTTSGRDRVRSVAKALIEADEAPIAIVSSPLVRALQTAEIVAANAKVEAPVEIRRELAPGGENVALVGELFSAGRRRVMVTGHEPDLSILVAQLIGRMPGEGMLKAMVVGLKLSPGDGPGYTAKLRFVLDPKSLELTRA
jgi:phosphohistidine phosphatase